jgi:hypothetical protein
MRTVQHATLLKSYGTGHGEIDQEKRACRSLWVFSIRELEVGYAGSPSRR